MGHIVFAAPGIDRFHLHERLRRELQQRGHTVTVLCFDPVAHTFWRHQDGATAFLAAGTPDAMQAPLGDLAARDCERMGIPRASPAARHWHRRVHEDLARWLPSLVRWFEGHRPDLVMLHQSRRAEHCLVQFVAREAGSRVLWIGDGLLPHTLQVDDRGIDGDASATLRRAGDYRVVRGEPSLLQACLTNLLARTTPWALSHRGLVVPTLRSRLADVWPALSRRGFGGALAALLDWQRALPERPAAELPSFELPSDPFVAVLLQDRNDERMRLDAYSPPTPRELVTAAAIAAARLDQHLHLVVVLPSQGLRRRDFHGLRTATRLHFVAAHAAPEAAATAVATITNNHPLASAALLAGTPVLHTGRALYGLHGVTTQVPTAGLPDALPLAIARDHPTLRQRFLSWLFGYGHVWCSAVQPDHNGLIGLVQAIESRLAERSPDSLQLRYRKGPAWPLAAEGRSH